MPPAGHRSAHAALPLLLALPAGTIVGLHCPVAAPDDDLDSRLARFGPRLRTEVALRHAVGCPPPQAIVELEPEASVASDTALALLAAAGTVVLLIAPGLGTLVRLCHRILRLDGPTPGWVAAESLRAGRALLMRVEGEGSGRWFRLSLRGEPVEGVLVACRAQGLVVLESRVDYEWPVAR